MTADEFTYTDATAHCGELKRFNVYRANGAPLGHVAQLQSRMWAAVDPDTRDQTRRRTRNLAVTGLWGAR